MMTTTTVVSERETATPRRHPLTLSDEKPDPDPRHVKPIKPRLYIDPNIPRVMRPLPLEHALRDGRHRRIVPLLDQLERARKLPIVFLHFGRPVDP